MSGIAAMFDTRGGIVDPVLLARMTTAVAHRGPDGSEIWTDGEVGLGHRRLGRRSTGVTTDASGTLRSILDGRIDNRDEIRRMLEADGIETERADDSTLLVEAYARWGSSFLELAVGDFALVIWDPRQRTLWCARDALGVKPLYYHFDGRRLLVASEPAQILEAVQARPNLSLVARYLADDYSERSETLYRDIHRLEPAHTLTAGTDGIRIERYWDIDPSCQVRYGNDADYDEHFSDLFRRAVAARLETDGTVGALLSGGLDSSSIVCTAADLYRRAAVDNGGFETYSMLFDTLACDEREYIKAVERHCGFPSNSFRYESEDGICDLDASAEHPEIRYAPITVAMGSVLSHARDNGVRVLLSGTGGDEFLASGFHHLTDLAAAGRWWTLVRQLRSDADLYSTSATRLFGEYCIKPFVPGAVLDPVRRFKRHLASNEEPDWLVPEVRERVAAQRASRRDDVAVEFPTHTQRFLHDVLLYNSNLTYAVGENDVLGSRYSIEYRYPFLDRRVVEFLIAIPEEQRWWMDRPKTILRRALRNVLPEEIRERRTKAEFSIVLDREVRGGLRDQVETLIRESRLASLGVVNRAGLLRRFRAFVDGREQPISRWAIFNFIGLELWSRSLAGPGNGGGPG